MDTWKFWKQTIERMVKAFAYSLTSVSLVGVAGLLDVDWGPALSAAALTSVISLLGSIVSSRLGGDPDSPSAVSTE